MLDPSPERGAHVRLWNSGSSEVSVVLLGMLLSLFILSGPGWSQEAEPAAEPPAADGSMPIGMSELSVEQARLADRYKRLEEVIGRLAELSDSTDPRRAKLLREAIAQSREQDVSVRFESIVKLLEDERLSAAATGQSELREELNALLTLLLKADRDRELASQRKRIRKYIKEVGRLIRMQKGIRARTEGGDELGPLVEDQQRTASDTGKLGGDISDAEAPKSGASNDGKEEDAESDEQPADEAEKQPSDDQPKPSDDQSKLGDSSKPSDGSKPSDKKLGKPSEGIPSPSQPGKGEPSEGQPSKPGQSPPSESQGQPQSAQGHSDSDEQQPSEPQDPAERAAKRLRAAQQRMEDARKKLEEAERKGAVEKQREALKDLELAKAELERVLRQLREEEMERTLTQLSARFRRMLEVQNTVYESTVRLDRVPEAQRDHDDEIEAGRLSRQESQIVDEAERCLLLLREEGSSVAFPEAVEQMRDDMKQVVKWLSAVKVGKLTQSVEQEIIAALEEMIAALEKAKQDLEKNRARPRAASGDPGEQDLVQRIAELKMIRSLQARIYQRTQRYGEMIDGEQAETEDLLEALAELAERQERVYRATADLQQERNN